VNTLRGELYFPPFFGVESLVVGFAELITPIVLGFFVGFDVTEALELFFCEPLFCLSDIFISINADLISV
jgi:hypothetical protein